MTEKNSELPLTNSALESLHQALDKLNDVLSDKSQQIAQSQKLYKKEIDEREKQLRLLKTSSQNIMNNINSVISRLDKVLENDGTSNNNN